MFHTVDRVEIYFPDCLELYLTLQINRQNNHKKYKFSVVETPHRNLLTMSLE